MISACILIRTEHGKFDEVTQRLKQFKEAKEIFPVHGRYDVIVDVEAPNYETLGSAIIRINRLAGVVFSESAVEAKTM